MFALCNLNRVIFFQEEEQHTRLTKLKEEDMKRRHEIEKKRLPKIQRDEIKSKTQQYRKSLRIEKRMSVDIERELMKEVSVENFVVVVVALTWSKNNIDGLS